MDDKEIEVNIALKIYPFMVINGYVTSMDKKTMKINVSKLYKNDLLKYFPKAVFIRIKKKDNKFHTIGEGNPVEIKDIDKNTIQVIISLLEHTIIKPDELNN